METYIKESYSDKKPYHHRVSQKKKDANDQAWYKHHLKSLDKKSFNNTLGFGGVPEYRRMKANYDLFNNIIDKNEFAYVCKPFGDTIGELPAEFSNKDIISSKIKVLLGMEMKRPFSWKVLAVNEEATTRKEQEHFGRIKEYVMGEIMSPIMMEIQKKAMAETQGQELTPEQERELQQQIEQQVKAATPEETKKYMARDHQDPAEALAHQLLEYLIHKHSMADVFNDGWKHALISGIEVYWEGSGPYGTDVVSINPLNFDFDRSPTIKYIEDGEWGCYEMELTPSQIVAMFSNELTNEEIDEIYEYASYSNGAGMADATFDSFSFGNERGQSNGDTIRVFHGTFKSLKKIGFLKSINLESGEIEESVQDEWYEFNEEIGDLDIEWRYLPETHEGYIIGKDMYKRMRPVPGQFQDLNNLDECKLPYKGAVYDNMNSEPTSIVDRMKTFQFYYNIVMYRIEMLMASDKGKIVFMNMKAIPKSLGVDLNKFLYYSEALKIGFLNPGEEGGRDNHGSIGDLIKEVDLSLVSQIDKYIQLAEYLDTRAGNTVGITKALEGQAGSNEAVTNNQMNYTQSSFIVEPLFELHNQVKRNLLEGLLKTAKSYYSGNNAQKLAYVIDDLSTKILEIDAELLDNSSYGLFISNSSKSWDAKQMVQQLGHAAMQNNKAELSDIIKVIRAESIQEAEELLNVAEQRAQEREMQMEEQRNMAIQEEGERVRTFRREEMEHEKAMIVLKEQERRKTEIQKQTILSLGFNEDKDMDKDGVPDILEVAKFGVDANIRAKELELNQDKQKYQEGQDKIKNDLAREKLAIDRKKANQSPRK